MFGRDKTPAPPATPAEAASPPVKEGGKGRATPSRKEAEARNRRPVVGAAPPPRGATRAERKAQRAARTVANREARQRNAAAIAAGDERALPARDKGPVRRFVRDYVDARRNLGEFFLPVALVSILIGFVGVPAARLASLVLLYVMVLAIIVDSILLYRGIKRVTDKKFDGKGTAGVATYALMRALQIRRARMPKPMVTRGQYPR